MRKILILSLSAIVSLAACDGSPSAPLGTREPNPPQQNPTNPIPTVPSGQPTVSMTFSSPVASATVPNEFDTELQVSLLTWDLTTNKVVPRAGVAVDFTVTLGRGVLATSSATTGADGVARVNFHYPLNDLQILDAGERGQASKTRIGITSCDAAHAAECSAKLQQYFPRP